MKMETERGELARLTSRAKLYKKEKLQELAFVTVRLTLSGFSTIV